MVVNVRDLDRIIRSTPLSACYPKQLWNYVQKYKKFIIQKPAGDGGGVSSYARFRILIACFDKEYNLLYEDALASVVGMIMFGTTKFDKKAG